MIVDKMVLGVVVVYQRIASDWARFKMVQREKGRPTCVRYVSGGPFKSRYGKEGNGRVQRFNREFENARALQG